MIGPIVEHMLTDGYNNDYMISEDNVAHVMEDNTALHAALILVSVGYNSIPVLNKENQFLGTISLADILSNLFEVEADSYQEYLSNIQVKTIMNYDAKAVKYPYAIEEMMHQLVNQNYVAVVGENEQFIGILTRKELLKAINYLAHELEKEYLVSPKEKLER